VFGEALIPGTASHYHCDCLIGSSSHEFIQPNEERLGRVMESYKLSTGSISFSPQDCHGVVLNIHANGDRINVSQRATVVLKVCFVDILDDLYEDGISKFSEV